MSIEDELKEKQKEREQEKAKEKKQKQAEKQAEAEKRVQEIKKLQQQVSEYDKRVRELKTLTNKLSSSLDELPEAKQQAVKEAQAEEAIQDKYDELQDQYNPAVLADVGIETFDEFKDKLTSDEDEKDLWERLEKAGVPKEDRDSELRYQVTKANQQLITEKLADLLHADTQSPEELMDKAQEEINNLEAKRQELYYQTPEGKEELKNEIAEQIQERHDDLRHKYFSDKFQNYQIEHYRRLVDTKDIQASEQLGSYGIDGEKFVKDEIVNTYVSQLEEQIENKKDRRNIEWLEVLREFDRWRKDSRERKEFNEKKGVLDDEADKLEEIMGDNGVGGMFEYGLVKNNATGESLNRQVESFNNRAKKMDRLRRKIKKGNFRGNSIKIYDIDYYTEKVNDLIEIVRQKQNMIQEDAEENPEYWQEVGRIAASRSGSGDTEKFEEGQDKLEFNLEIEDETVAGQLGSDWNSGDSDQVAPRGIDTNELTPSKINDYSLEAIEDSLKEEKENIEKERKEKEKRIKEKVEYDFARQKVEQAKTGKRLQEKREIIEEMKEGTAGLGAEIANFRNEHEELLPESIQTKKDTIEMGFVDDLYNLLRDLNQDVDEIKNTVSRKQNQIEQKRQELKNSWFSGSLEGEIENLETEVENLQEEIQNKKEQIKETEEKINASHELSSLFKQFNENTRQASNHEGLTNLQLQAEDGMTVDAVLTLMDNKIDEIQDLSISDVEREQIREYEKLLEREQKAREVYERAGSK